MDICLITIDNNLNKSLQPKSAIGMLWLQTHFENDQWEALSNSTVIISEENSQLLIEDATNALGVTFNGERVGSLEADMTIFSTNSSNGKFAVAAGAPIILNIFLILSIFYAKHFDQSYVKSMSLAVFISGLTQMLILIFYCKKYYKPKINLIIKITNKIKLIICQNITGSRCSNGGLVFSKNNLLGCRRS